MLDSFLEYNIQKKYHIFSTLYLQPSTSIKDLCETLKISSASILSLIDELNFDFQGIAKIEKYSSTFKIIVYDEDCSFDIFYSIYKNSCVLHCLKFMITNDTNISFSKFAEEHFLTRPSAYRVRQKCVNYLHKIGLEVQKNKVVGNEYRIRFLIALLYYKYGIDCCDIEDEHSIRIAREFIVSTNNKINMDFLEYTLDEYGYFECLLILAWKRKDYSVTFKTSNELEKLKELFVYRELKKCLQQTIEKTLNIIFSESDYDYIFLVYCCTNSCIFADKWLPKDIELVHKIVFSNPKFSYLLHNPFGEKCCMSMQQSHAFRSVIIYFYKKCLFDLHCIIPDKHFYLELKNDPLNVMVTKCMFDMINKWKNKYNISYPFSKGHLQYLSIQITSIIRQAMHPVQIIIVSDLISEVEVLKLFITRNFPQQRAIMKSVLLNAQDLAFLSKLNNSVIIVKNVFARLLSSLNLSESNIIVSINIEINALDRKKITNAIVNCEKNIFENFITQ